MKQMDECLGRFYEGKPPLSKKWRAFPSENRYLFLTHYHHLVLVYDYKEHKSLHEWAELPTDKRGLSAALKYITEEHSDRLPAGFSNSN